MRKSILLICIMLLIITTSVFAAPDPNVIIRKGYANPIYMENISNPGGNVSIVIKQVTVLLGAAGIGIGVCVGFIYAIMWITATPAKKADLKERMLPLVLGVFLLFGGTGLAATFISGVAGMLQ